ncbi:NAD(P)-binding protein [Annulohypoxylon maeteangense]|uniref:NAD(P)-binding protein n=1 Tax=Annulohypoxylon maeteangense TaxID=1927788 RepID=UPI002008C7BA|nr:NAD(P)-binding protein [Annulohypoxylon maeteangense]KAI0885414.1 NAD(P)-binding protein [Annulohypoxylon maeteangense]
MSTSTPSRTILVVGATGQQGGFVLSELANLLSSLSSGTKPEVNVLALTRTASSPKAQALPSKYPSLHLTVVEGDTRNPAPIFEAYPQIDSVFSYTTPPDEEPQANLLIDAVAAHVRKTDTQTPHSKKIHFVFSSVDRGGEPQSWENPTDIPHFREKHNIEIHLKAKADESEGRLTYTILRPVAFMDNLNPGGTFGMVFASLWSTMPASQKLQLVSVRDIGLFGAEALLASPASPHFLNRAIGLAGDNLTLGEARDIYRRVSKGRELPQAWWVVGWAVRGLVAAKHVGAMFTWFETHGYGVDVEALRRWEPGVLGFEAWLRESSRFEIPEGGSERVR